MKSYNVYSRNRVAPEKAETIAALSYLLSTIDTTEIGVAMRTKIYFLRDEAGFVRYVGKTKHPLCNRLKGHLHEAETGGVCRRHKGIRAMLRRDFTPTIDLITEVEGDGCGAEIAYIKWLRSKGIELWNAADGGEGRCGPYSQETKNMFKKLRNTQEYKLAQSKRLKEAYKIKMSTPEGMEEMRKRAIPMHRQNVLEKLREARCTTEYKEAKRIEQVKVWADPELRKKHSLICTKIFANPIHRAKVSRGIRASWDTHPEQKKRRSDALKASWNAHPERKEKQVVAFKIHNPFKGTFNRHNKKTCQCAACMSRRGAHYKIGNKLCL